MRLSSTWMLQEISESSSNRIVQRISWSKERMLGLRNRSIFILLLVLFQLLMSADPQNRRTRTYKDDSRIHTRTYVHMCLLVWSCHPLWRPWKWMGGWMREWMDATEREGGELAPVSFLPTDGSTGGRMAFPLVSLSLSLSNSLSNTFFLFQNFSMNLDYATIIPLVWRQIIRWMNWFVCVFSQVLRVIKISCELYYMLFDEIIMRSSNWCGRKQAFLFIFSALHNSHTCEQTVCL